MALKKGDGKKGGGAKREGLIGKALDAPSDFGNYLLDQIPGSGGGKKKGDKGKEKKKGGERSESHQWRSDPKRVVHRPKTPTFDALVPARTVIEQQWPELFKRLQ